MHVVRHVGGDGWQDHARDPGRVVGVLSSCGVM